LKLSLLRQSFDSITIVLMASFGICDWQFATHRIQLIFDIANLLLQTISRRIGIVSLSNCVTHIAQHNL